jgi:hypothetical protein
MILSQIGIVGMRQVGAVTGGWPSFIAVVLLGCWGLYKFFDLSSLRNERKQIHAAGETALDALVFAAALILFAVDLRSSGKLGVVAIIAFLVLWLSVIAIFSLVYRSGRIFWEDLFRNHNGRRE